MIKLLNIISEIKILGGKFPKEMELYNLEDLDKYPIVRDYQISKKDEIKINNYFRDKLGDDDYYDLSGRTLKEAAIEWGGDDFSIEWLAHIINGLFPEIKVITIYNNDN